MDARVECPLIAGGSSVGAIKVYAQQPDVFTERDEHLLTRFAANRLDGGYLNNDFSGYLPKCREEPVRGLFISSAAELIEESQVDGL